MGKKKDNCISDKPEEDYQGGSNKLEYTKNTNPENWKPFLNFSICSRDGLYIQKHVIIL